MRRTTRTLGSASAFGAGVLLLAASLPAGADAGPQVGPGAGSGNGDGDPFVGDVTGDGIDDVVEIRKRDLGSTVTTKRCVADIQPGLPTGGNGPAYQQEFTIVVDPLDDPDRGLNRMECPTIGAVLDIGGDGRQEIYLTWFEHNNGEVVLRDWETLSARLFFSDEVWELGVADIDGDGLEDVWAASGDERYFKYLRNSAGAEELQAVYTPFCPDAWPYEWRMADLVGDGGLDVVGFDVCGSGGPAGRQPVATVFDLVGDTEQELLARRWENYEWRIVPVDVDADGDLDIRVEPRPRRWRPVDVATPASLFLNDGAGRFSEVPVVEERFAVDAGGMVPVLGGRWAQSQRAYRVTHPAKDRPELPNNNIAVHEAEIDEDFVLEARPQVKSTPRRSDDVSVLWDFADEYNYTYVNFAERNEDDTSGVFVVRDGGAFELADIDTTIRPGRTFDVRVERRGGELTVHLDGELVVTAPAETPFSDRGVVGLTYPTQVGIGSRNDAVWLDDLVVTRGLAASSGPQSPQERAQ